MPSGNGAGPSSAEEFRARARKLVELPSGLKIEIRRLVGIDWVEAGYLTASGKQGPRARRQATDEDASRWLTDLVTRAAIRPKIVAGCHPSEVPEDAIHIKDLDDQEAAALIQAIMDFSGFGGTRVEGFCTGQAGDSGSDGEEVQRAPEPDPTARSGGVHT